MRRLRLIAPGLSARLLRVRKVMGSPRFWDGAAAVDWARILDSSDDEDLLGVDRESIDICEDSDEYESSPLRDASLL